MFLARHTCPRSTITYLKKCPYAQDLEIFPIQEISDDKSFLHEFEQASAKFSNVIEDNEDDLFIINENDTNFQRFLLKK